MKRKALNSGITGQDGSYLAEIPLDKDYEVRRMVRQIYSIKHIRKEVELHPASVESYPSVYRVW